MTFRTSAKAAKVRDSQDIYPTVFAVVYTNGETDMFPCFNKGRNFVLYSKLNLQAQAQISKLQISVGYVYVSTPLTVYKSESKISHATGAVMLHQWNHLEFKSSE